MTTVPITPVASSIVALDRHARDHVAEFDLAGLLGENRHVVRIPLHEGLALLHLAAVGHGDDGAEDDVVALEFAAVLVCTVMEPFLFSAIQLPSSACTVRSSLKLNLAVVLRLDDRLLEGLTRCHRCGRYAS